MNELTPLHNPTPWPPPECSPNTDRELAWRGFPLIGRLLTAHLSHRRWRKHYLEVLLPIERQIIDQLRQRPHENAWKYDESRGEVATLMAQAVAHEKSIDLPALHPHDPIELLFWGACDDMTPLVFALGLRERFGIDLPRQAIVTFWENHWVVDDVLDYCLAQSRTL